MKGFKDSVHATNDILLAIVIIIVAAGLIIWRLHIIVTYPERMTQQNPTTTEQREAAKSAKDKNLPMGPAFSKDKLTKDVTVTVTSDGGENGVKDLIDKGLFKDYAQYRAAVKDLKLDEDQINAGKYDFKAGTSAKNVIKVMFPAQS